MGTGARHYLLTAPESGLKAKHTKGIRETNFKEARDDEINSYAACVQLVNHPNAFGIRAKRGNQLPARVLILGFQ